MKKNKLSILALLLAAASLAVSLLTMNRETADHSAQLTILEQQNAELTAKVNELSVRLDELNTASAAGGLAVWTLDASPWADGTGADILLTALPEVWSEELHAEFVVQLEGQQILSVPCSRNGTAFTATASLSAADGYGYYLVMDIPGGTRQSHDLTTPENPVSDIPVYLASSLNSYCNLIVEGWHEEAATILLDAAYIHLQLPRIGEAGSVEHAQLVLLHNGKQVHSIPLTLQNDEDPNSYELTIHKLSLPLPETEADDQLELRLEVTLSSGTELTATGISWFRSGDTLNAVVG